MTRRERRQYRLFFVMVTAGWLGLMGAAHGVTLQEDFEAYSTNVNALLPNPPYEATDITAISGDNPGMSAYTDPQGVQGTVGGLKGLNNPEGAHHGVMRELPALTGPATQVVFRADFMSDWSEFTANTDNLLYLASGSGDRDLLIGVNDGRLSAFFEDPITTATQRLRGNGGNFITAGTWYTIRAVVTFPGSDPDGLLTADWKLASQPDTAFAAMMGDDSNTDIAAPDPVQADWLHWEIRNLDNPPTGVDTNTGSYADNILIEVSEGGPDVVMSESITVTNTIGVEFDSVTGESYSLEVTTNLVDWSQAGATIAGADTRLTMFDPSGSSTSKNYRVIRLP